MATTGQVITGYVFLDGELTETSVEIAPRSIFFKTLSRVGISSALVNARY